MNAEAQQLITALRLARLPHEGGWFRQVWQSPETIRSGRSLCGLIYFLMTAEDFSALHRLQTPEIWHHYAGDPVQHVQLEAAGGAATVTLLGPEVIAGQTPHLLVEGNIWQGASLAADSARGWALLGCTMAPAWDKREFELGARNALLRTFPSHAALVRALTR